MNIKGRGAQKKEIMALISIFHLKNTPKRSDLHLYWSHSSSEEAGKLLARKNCQILLLFSMTFVGGGDGDDRENHVEDDLADGDVDDEDE